MFIETYLEIAMGFPLRRRAVLAAALSILYLLTPALVAAQSDLPVVAAASDLQFAVTEIAEAFTAETGMEVRLSFGSTGNFARQIREGAPFEIFMAADEIFITDLHAQGLAPDEGDLYGVGRIVIMVPNGSRLTPDPEMNNLAEMLEDGQINRFAIANPEHAPYVMRAREALME